MQEPSPGTLRVIFLRLHRALNIPRNPEFPGSSEAGRTLVRPGRTAGAPAHHSAPRYHAVNCTSTARPCTRTYDARGARARQLARHGGHDITADRRPAPASKLPAAARSRSLIAYDH